MVVSAESYGPKNEECLSLLRTLGIPVVLADCFDKAGDFSMVAIDNTRGSVLAVRHLLDLGHRRIGCVTGPQGIQTNRERLAGYTETLAAADLAPNPALIYEGDFRYQSGYEGAVHLLEQNPTAIFCHNDMMALGAVNALRDRGRKVPAEISVIGFDDIFFSRYMDVPLTTVKQPVYKMGLEAASILLDEIGDKDKPKQCIMYDPQLIVRQSTMSPPR
jgi:LacI family transcriptional regulator